MRPKKTPSPPRFPLVEVSAGLILRENNILITQRLPQVHLGGLWEFPGGKRGRGETWKGSLKRELLEELGLKVTVGRFLQDVIHHYPTKSVRIRFYLCRSAKGDPAPLACQRLTWVSISDLARFKFPDADRKFLSDLRRGRFRSLLQNRAGR